MTAYQPIPVTTDDGQSFPSMEVAAKALGIGNTTVRRHMLQFGEVRFSLVAEAGGHAPRPVTTNDGRSFASLSAASRELGVARGTIVDHVRRYGEVRLPVRPQEMACIVNGKRYDSIKAAAAALGIKGHTLSYHLERYGDVSRAGKRNKGCKAWNQQPIRLGPFKWESQSAAARDLGIGKTTLRQWLSPNASARQRENLAVAVMQLAHRQRKAA